MTDRVGPATVWIPVLLAAALAGCVQSPDPAAVPAPEVGATARYTGQGRVVTMDPGPIWAGPGQDPVEVRLGENRPLTVRLEPPKTVWDMYQDDHGVVPFNWSYSDGERTWPLRTSYVSRRTGEVITQVADRSAPGDGPALNTDRTDRGKATLLGGSLFWGQNLEVGRTFSRHVARKALPSTFDALQDRVPLRFTIEAREPVGPWDAYRVELENPRVLRSAFGPGAWESLTYWVSPETPFVVQRRGTYATEARSWSGTVRLAGTTPGDGPVRIDRASQSYAWEPRRVDLAPWDGVRPPGNASTFADPPMDSALEILEQRDPTTRRYRTQHPDAMVAEAIYTERGKDSEWRFRFAEPTGRRGLVGRVERSGEGPVAWNTTVSSRLVEDPPWSWTPPDAYDRLLSVDGCWHLWNATTGNTEWFAFVVGPGASPYCGFAVGSGDAGASAGFLFGFRHDGAIDGGPGLPVWPRR